MPFVRRKGKYFVLVKGVRKGANVNQKVIAHLGEWSTISEAVLNMRQIIEAESRKMKGYLSEIRKLKRLESECPDFFEKDRQNRIYIKQYSTRINAEEKKVRTCADRISRHSRTLKKLSPFLPSAPDAN